MSNNRIETLGQIRIITLSILFIVLFQFTSSQNLYFKKGIQIDYLALEINFSDTSFSFYQKQMLKGKIEEAIAEHNSSNPKFHIYLVDELEAEMTGFRMNLTDFVLPDKKSQHLAFYLSIVGLVATPALLIAANSNVIFLYWFTTHNHIYHETYLSTALSSKSEVPIKYKFRSNGGWFKKTEVNEESIINKFDYKFRKLIQKIHTSYRPLKEIRNRTALTFQLPTTFDEELNPDLTVSERTDSKLVQSDSGSVDGKKGRIAWWSLDIEAGMSFPAAEDINSSFSPMFTMGLGPKWKLGEDFRFKPFFSMDLMIKNQKSNVSVGEVWFNSRLGLQLEYTMFPGSSDNFNIYPLVNLSYSSGNYNFENLNIEVPDYGTTSLKHRGLTLGGGIGFAASWFTCTLYYNYYNPKFSYKSGPTYGKEFNSTLNMSTFSLKLGASIW